MADPRFVRSWQGGCGDSKAGGLVPNTHAFINFNSGGSYHHLIKKKCEKMRILSRNEAENI